MPLLPMTLAHGSIPQRVRLNARRERDCCGRCWHQGGRTKTKACIRAIVAGCGIESTCWSTATETCHWGRQVCFCLFSGPESTLMPMLVCEPRGSSRSSRFQSRYRGPGARSTTSLGGDCDEDPSTVRGVILSFNFIRLLDCSETLMLLSSASTVLPYGTPPVIG